MFSEFADLVCVKRCRTVCPHTCDITRGSVKLIKIPGNCRDFDCQELLFS
jgi:hypothetical protein